MYRIIVTKGSVSAKAFEAYCGSMMALVFANTVQRNMQKMPNGTQIGCSLSKIGDSGACQMDMKLVRDFNLMDKVRFFGLKKALFARGR